MRRITNLFAVVLIVTACTPGASAATTTRAHVLSIPAARRAIMHYYRRIDFRVTSCHRSSAIRVICDDQMLISTNSGPYRWSPGSDEAMLGDHGRIIVVPIDVSVNASRVDRARLTIEPSAPTYSVSSALQASMDAARRYWGVPACGVPHDMLAVIPGDTGLTVLPGTGPAPPAMCMSYIERWVAEDAIDGPEQFGALCQIVTHEWGHLILGPYYFAATNPSEPSESPDPNSIMSVYAGAQITKQCVTAMNHAFIFDGRYVTVRATLSGDRCSAVMRDREGAVWGKQRWPCRLTD